VPWGSEKPDAFATWALFSSRLPCGGKVCRLPTVGALGEGLATLLRTDRNAVVITTVSIDAGCQACMTRSTSEEYWRMPPEFSAGGKTVKTVRVNCKKM
jgi:hypothetical protein